MCDGVSVYVYDGVCAAFVWWGVCAWCVSVCGCVIDGQFHFTYCNSASVLSYVKGFIHSIINFLHSCSCLLYMYISLFTLL